MRAWVNFKGYDSLRGKFSVWIFEHLKSEIENHRRRSLKERSKFIPMDDRHFLSPDPSPEETASTRKELWHICHDGYSVLSARQKQALDQVVWDEINLGDYPFPLPILCHLLSSELLRCRSHEPPVLLYTWEHFRLSLNSC